MTPYGPSHLVPLALFVVGVVVVIAVGRRERRVDPTAGPSLFSRVGAVLIPAVTLPFQAVDILTDYDIDTTLPLHLCDLAWIAATWALWTHRPFPVALTYYWGLVLTVQGIITPSLNMDVPHPRYFAFWGLHLLIVWAALYLVVGRRLVPRWRDYEAVVAATVVWAGATYVFNVVADTNYGYLRRKPPTGSILDLLGPWPWYVVAEIALVAGVWALLTVAARGRPDRRGSPAA